MASGVLFCAGCGGVVVSVSCGIFAQLIRRGGLRKHTSRRRVSHQQKGPVVTAAVLAKVYFFGQHLEFCACWTVMLTMSRTGSKNQGGDD